MNNILFLKKYLSLNEEEITEMNSKNYSATNFYSTLH